MARRVMALSNHGNMVGGGEYSFLDLCSHLPVDWKAIAVVPHEGELAVRLRRRGLETQVIRVGRTFTLSCNTNLMGRSIL